jgi:hypothetical protein
MKQYFKQTQQHAYYGAGVMETGDHSTNGVSPKSLTSRRNIYLAILTAFTLLTRQSVFAQDFYYGFSWDNQTVMIDDKQTDCAVVRYVSEHLPAKKAGLHAGDVIIAVDGQSIDALAGLDSKAKTTLSVKRFGNRNINLDMSGIPCLSKNSIAESSYAMQDIIGQTDFYVTEKTLGIEPINIMYDPDVDFFQYGSFDFEFTGQNIMQQKEIAPELESWLIKRGLLRDRENPDMLVFIEFYSDRREQYVPPTQELSTRYGTSYNVWTKRHESRQYVESYQKGNYTKVEYLSKLSVSMVDAKKLSKGETEKAKIWQADYEVLYEKKADHKEFAFFIGTEMVLAFPFKTKKMTTFSYYYTGIIYDREIAGQVNGVIPNSPAEKAGIKSGDIIKRCSWGTQEIFKKSYNKLNEPTSSNLFTGMPIGIITETLTGVRTNNLQTYHFNHGDFELTRASNSRYENYKDNSPFQFTYMSYYKKRKNAFAFDEISHGSKPLIFTIKNVGGITKQIEVDPIITMDRIFVY